MPDELKQAQIIGVIAEDEQALPIVMQILAQERKTNKQLISDMNLVLSQTDIYIRAMPEPTKANPGKLVGITKAYLAQKIATLYEKYKTRVTHIFKEHE